MYCIRSGTLILVFGPILQNFFNEHKIPTREIATTYVNNGSINGAICSEHKNSNSMPRMYPFGLDCHVHKYKGLLMKEAASSHMG